MKSITIFKKIFPILALALLVSCATKMNRVSEMGNFTIRVEKIAGTTMEKVTLTGEVLDSALWIKEYRIVYGPDFVDVEIFRSLQKTGNNGPYDIEFLISSQIREIRLGEETVWKRL